MTKENKKIEKIIEEINEFVADERDNIAKDTNAFNQLNDEYKEGYWMAMNTVMKYLESLTNKNL